MDTGLLATIAAVVGTLGVLGSLLFSAAQTRELARQTRIQNSLAATSSIREIMYSLDAVNGIMIEHPELRPYFYEGEECPESGSLRTQVLVLAEMYIDKLDVGLHTTASIRETDSYEDWCDFTIFLLSRSPAIRGLINDHGRQWWPLTTELWTSTDRASQHAAKDSVTSLEPTE